MPQVLKMDSRLSNIPVLVFSARVRPEEVEKALTYGATGDIVKATTGPNEVVEQIEKVLRQKPKAYEIIRSNVEIKEDVHEAKKLASDFNMDDLKYLKCGGGALLLELIPDFSQ